MRILFKPVITVAAILIIANTITGQQNKLQTLHWLTGTWVMQMKAGKAYEVWQYVNDSTYQSNSYIKKANGDSIPQESVKLVYRNGKMFYIPTVPGQNNNQAVSFTITTLKENEFIAENPAHDFPQRITYILKAPGKLYASIDGNFKGKFRKEEYEMVKE